MATLGEEGGGLPGPGGLAAPPERTQRVAVFVDVEVRHKVSIEREREGERELAACAVEAQRG